MKKVLLWMLMIIILFHSGALIVSAKEPMERTKPVVVMIDGNEISFDVEPIIRNGRTLVPFRAIFEALDATVAWDDTTQTCIAASGKTTIMLTIGSSTMIVDGNEKKLDSPAILQNERTLVPLRAISEALSCQVGWDGDDATVSIIHNAGKYRMLYAPNDRSRAFLHSEVAVQLRNGWFLEKNFEESIPEGNEDVARLDGGKCGESLYWELREDGVLRIYGTGAMYDYVKNIQPAPWFYYRKEPYISADKKLLLNPDGSTYADAKDYYANNPNGYQIKKILIEDGVTYLGDWAFYRVCVEELIIPEGVEGTGYFCIRYSPTLKTIILPDSLKVLNDFAISRNQVLTTIQFGEGLEEIGRAGLQNNPQLEAVYFPKSLTTINEQLHSPYYPDKDYSNLGLLEGCSSLRAIDFGGVKSIPQRTCNGTNLEEAIIPSSVEFIGEYAFLNNKNLKTVLFEDESKCTRIEKSAFMNCSSLQSVTNGTAIEEIRDNAFLGAKDMTEFTFSDTNRSFVKNLFLGTQLKRAEIKGNVKVIPQGIFAQSELEEVTISQGVEEIQNGAFSGCKNLKKIYYQGSYEDWCRITKETGWAGGHTPQTCEVVFSNQTSEPLSKVK